MRSSKKKRRVGPSLAERSRACGHFWKCIVLIIILVARSRRADIRKSALRAFFSRADFGSCVRERVCERSSTYVFTIPGSFSFRPTYIVWIRHCSTALRRRQRPTVAPARPRGAFERRVPVSRDLLPELSTVRRVKLSRPISDHSEPLEHPDVKDQTLLKSLTLTT